MDSVMRVSFPRRLIVGNSGKDMAMDFESLNLSPDQMERVKAVTDALGQVEIDDAEGIELTDEQLEQVAGGADIYKSCPFCGKEYYLASYDPSDMLGIVVQGTMTCECGRKFGYAFRM